MSYPRRAAAIPRAVIDAWVDDDLPVLRTQTTGTRFARRDSLGNTVIIDRRGARPIDPLL